MGKLMMRLFTTLHAKLVKATGRLGGGSEDGSVLVLDHVGAKSGKRRTTPLMFVRHEEVGAIGVVDAATGEHVSDIEEAGLTGGLMTIP